MTSLVICVINEQIKIWLSFPNGYSRIPRLDKWALETDSFVLYLELIGTLESTGPCFLDLEQSFELRTNQKSLRIKKVTIAIVTSLWSLSSPKNDSRKFLSSKNSREPSHLRDES